MATAATPTRRSSAGTPPIPTVRAYTEVLDKGTKSETRPRMAEATLNGVTVTIGDRVSDDVPEDRVYLNVDLPRGGTGGTDSECHYTIAEIRDFIAVLLAAFHRAKRDGLLPGRAPVEIVR
jgi:hypothetical protein